jgi:long-chain acyl-CoA synthetase
MFEMGPYEWLTYQETFDKITRISHGLLQFGVKPRSKLAIYCNTGPEWMTTSHACFGQAISVVTMYANLGDEAILFGLQDTKCEYIVTSGDLVMGTNNNNFSSALLTLLL